MNDWKKRCLSELIEVRHGFPFQSRHFTDEPTPYVLLTPGNFAVGGGFQFGRSKYYSGVVPDEFMLKSGDLLVSMTDLSKSSDTLGYPAFIPDLPNIRFLHNQRLGKVTIENPRDLESKYLYYLLCTKEYRNEILASATGTAVKHTAPSRIKAFEFYLPSLHEQRAIARVLNVLDERIELNRQMSDTLEAMGRALFKSWFVDFDPVTAKTSGRKPYGLNEETASLFPDRFIESELGLIPESWCVGTIDEATCLIIDHRGKTPKKLGGDWSETGIPAISAKNIKTGRIVNRGSMNFVDEVMYHRWMKEKLEVGDILMTSEAPLGELLYLANVIELCLSQRVFALRADPEKCFSSYLYFWLASESTQESLQSRATGTTVQGIRQSELRRVEVLLPPLSVQEKVTPLLQAALTKVDANQRENWLLSTLRDALLPKLLSGEIRVRQAEKVVAEAV